MHGEARLSLFPMLIHCCRKLGSALLPVLPALQSCLRPKVLHPGLQHCLPPAPPLPLLQLQRCQILRAEVRCCFLLSAASPAEFRLPRCLCPDFVHHAGEVAALMRARDFISAAATVDVSSMHVVPTADNLEVLRHVDLDADCGAGCS